MWKKFVIPLCISLGILVFPLTQAQENQSNKKPQKPHTQNEVLVQFKKQEINIESTYGQFNAYVFEIIEGLDKKEDLAHKNTIVYEIDEAESVEETITRLQHDPDIALVQPNYQYHPEGYPTDPGFSKQWSLDNVGQTVNGITGTSDADIDAPEGWDRYEHETDIIVAVIDNGVPYNHPDLKSIMWDGSTCYDEENNQISGGCPNHGWNFNPNSPQGEGNDPAPYNSDHGSHVAGIITSAHNNDEGIASVGKGIQMMAIHTSFTTSSVIKSIQFAENNGAQIISASFGGGGYDQLLKDAIDSFPGLYVASAGNSNTDNDEDIHYPSDYDLDNIICVAATDQDDKKASFSNYGATNVDVGAPGNNIYSTRSSYTAGNGDTVYGDGFAGGYMYMNGTSMAAPLVSGIAGTLLSHSPQLTYQEVKNLILSSGDSVSALNGITLSGKRVNLNNALIRLEKPEITKLLIQDINTGNTNYTSGVINFTLEANDNYNINGTYQTLDKVEVIDETSAVLHNESISASSINETTAVSLQARDSDVYQKTINVKVYDKDRHVKTQESTITIDTIPPTYPSVQSESVTDTEYQFTLSQPEDLGIGSALVKVCLQATEDETCINWTTTLTFTISNLEPNTSYPLYVSTRDGLGNTNPLTQINQFTTLGNSNDILDPTIQLSPQNTETKNEILLSWSLANNSRITISRDTSDLSCTDPKNEILTDSSLTSWSDSPLDSNITYYYRLFSVNENQVTSHSCKKLSQKTETPTVSAPSVTENQVNPDNETATVSIQWPVVFEANAYLVTINNDSPIQTSQTTYTKSDLPLSTSITVQVQAIRNNETGAASPTLTITTGTPSPQNLGFSQKTASSITWNWEYLGNENYVSLYQGASLIAQSGWLPSSTTQWTNNNLSSNTLYTIKIRGRDQNGNQTSESEFATYSSISLPTSPVISYVSQKEFTAKTATLENLNDQLSGYYFETSTQNSGWIKTPQFTASSLEPNTNYSIRAKARNALGEETDYSPWTQTLTLPDVPNIQLLPSQENQQEIKFIDEVSLEYHLLLDTTDTFSNPKTYLNWEIKYPNDTFLIPNLENNQTYHLQIRSRNASGTSAPLLTTFATTSFEFLNGTDDHYISAEEINSVSLDLDTTPNTEIQITLASDESTPLITKTATTTTLHITNTELKTHILDDLSQNIDHTLLTFIIDETGNKTRSPLQVLVHKDTTPPIANITSHSHQQVISNSPITLAGSITDSGSPTLTINNQSIPVENGIFEHLLSLEPGTNEITLVSQDLARNQTVQTITLTKKVEITNRLATPIDENQINISWNTDTPTTNNQVLLGTDENNLMAYPLSTDGTSNHSITIDQLNSETQYHYQVQSQLENEITTSDLASFHTPKPIDTQPTDSTWSGSIIFSPSENQINLTGDANDEIIVQSEEALLGEIKIQANTTITSPSNWDGIIQAPQKIEIDENDEETITNLFSNPHTKVHIQQMVEVGNQHHRLFFSHLVSLKVHTPSVADSTRLYAYYSHDHQDSWQPFDPPASCLTLNNYCELKVPNFSSIALITTSSSACTAQDWHISPWSLCTNGQQKRTITKTSSCEGEFGRPQETRSCGINTGSGKARTIRYKGMKRKDIRPVPMAGVALEDFEKEYQKSMEFIEKRNVEILGEILIKRDKYNNEKFVGYQAGKKHPNNFAPKESRIDEEKLWATLANRAPLRNAAPKKLTPYFTTMNLADIPPSHKDYQAISHVVSYRLLPPLNHKFERFATLSWTNVLDAVLKIKLIPVLTKEKLRALNPPSLRNHPLNRERIDYKTRVYYTAAQYGLIDQKTNLRKQPNKGQALKLLLEAFEIPVNEGAGVSRFKDIPRQDPVAPYIIAATNQNWFASYPKKIFRPAHPLSRIEFVGWMEQALNNYEENLLHTAPPAQPRNLHESFFAPKEIETIPQGLRIGNRTIEAKRIFEIQKKRQAKEKKSKVIRRVINPKEEKKGPGQ